VRELRGAEAERSKGECWWLAVGEDENGMNMPTDHSYTSEFYKAQSVYFMADNEMQRSWNRRQIILDAIEECGESEISTDLQLQLSLAEEEYSNRVSLRTLARGLYCSAGATI
jgi:hypothetical protein